jgi:hypothetical protein
MPRLEVSFPLVPINGTTDEVAANFSSTLRNLAGCGATAACEVSATAVLGDSSIYGRVQPIVSISAAISYVGVNRTVSCPPPPPKPLSAVDVAAPTTFRRTCKPC